MRVLSNPLIRLEAMQRFRGPWAAIGIMLALFIPAAVVSIGYAAATATSAESMMMMDPEMNGFGGDGPVFEGPAVAELDGVGPGLFFGVAGALLLVVVVMVPALAGGTIAGERANLTLAPLQISRLKPADIVLGKQVSSLAYLLLIVVCSSPLLMVPYLLGGVRVLTVVIVLAVIVMVAIEVAAVSMLVSSLMSRPAPAIVLSLMASFALVVGPFILMGIGLAIWAARNPMAATGDSPAYLVSAISPVSLGTWLAGPADVEVPFAGTLKVLAPLFWLVVTVFCLGMARWRVTAPVEVDR